MNQLISVILPVKDGTNYIREAIESLHRQDMDLEIIVVDDGSSDGTAELAESLGCQVIRHAVSRGQVAAKNTGLRAARGKYILFLDHDDRVRPGALRALYDVLETEADTAAVMARVQDFLSPDAGDMSGTVIRPDAYHGLFTGAVLIRKSALEETGPFSESLHTGEIIEWRTRMEDRGLKIKKIDLVATDRRIHRSNFGRTDGKVEFKDYAAVLRERLKAAKSRKA